MIDDYTIKRIKDAANIVDVVREFYPERTEGGLRKRGVEYECLCPFHEDRNYGSFKVSQRKNIYTCFSCGAQGGPIDFLMEHEHLSFPDALRWLGKKYGIDVEGGDTFEVKPSVPRPQLPPLPMLQLPMWMVQQRATTMNNTLVRWIVSGIKWGEAQRHRIYDVLKDYKVGESRSGMTIFWQIDDHDIVRTGKMMLYKPDGHRDKGNTYNFDWIHSALYRDPRNEYSADKTEMKQCLYGLHLLNRYRKGNQVQDVCIVESEKTAILMAIAYGNHPKQVWMACGGMENLNRSKLAPIIAQKRPIRLYPDRDGIEKWQEKARQLDYDLLTIDTMPVTKWWKPEDGEKADVADVVVRILNEGKKAVPTLNEILLNDPRLRELIDRIQLTPINTN